MKENKFLQQLKERAKQQSVLQKKVFFPLGFKIVSTTLGENPWKIFIPLSICITWSLYQVWGQKYFDAILFLFRRL